MAKVKKIVTIVKKESSIDVRDLQVTESEYNVLRVMLDWLRSHHYGGIEFTRHEDKIRWYVKQSHQSTIENPEFS